MSLIYGHVETGSFRGAVAEGGAWRSVPSLCRIMRNIDAICQLLGEGDADDPHNIFRGHCLDRLSNRYSCRSRERQAAGVGFVPHDEIRRVTEQSPHLGRLFWLSTVIDAAIQRTWITCLGRRSATQYMAHLFCELYLRLEAAGIATGFRFDFPLTQAQLADALGLSVVHVNKKLQELRASGLAEWKNGTVAIHDFEGLAELAEFDPTYLSLRVEAR